MYHTFLRYIILAQSADCWLVFGLLPQIELKQSSTWRVWVLKCIEHTKFPVGWELGTANGSRPGGLLRNEEVTAEESLPLKERHTCSNMFWSIVVQELPEGLLSALPPWLHFFLTLLGDQVEPSYWWKVVSCKLLPTSHAARTSRRPQDSQPDDSPIMWTAWQPNNSDRCRMHTA